MGRTQTDVTSADFHSNQVFLFVCLLVKFSLRSLTSDRAANLASLTRCAFHKHIRKLPSSLSFSVMSLHRLRLTHATSPMGLWLSTTTFRTCLARKPLPAASLTAVVVTTTYALPQAIAFRVRESSTAAAAPIRRGPQVFVLSCVPEVRHCLQSHDISLRNVLTRPPTDVMDNFANFYPCITGQFSHENWTCTNCDDSDTFHFEAGNLFVADGKAATATSTVTVTNQAERTASATSPATGTASA